MGDGEGRHTVNEFVTTKYSLQIDAHCKPAKSGSWGHLLMELCVYMNMCMHIYNIKRKQSHEGQT